MSGLWELLRGVLPQDSLRIGTITAVNANNTVTCSMASGGSLTVRGTGSVADVVFILNGEVRSTVSGLTTFAATDV
jgi:hypothetical protein